MDKSLTKVVRDSHLSDAETMEMCTLTTVKLWTILFFMNGIDKAIACSQNDPHVFSHTFGLLWGRPLFNTMSWN